MNNSKTSNITILLKAFDKASGNRNILKNSKDEKQRKRAKNNIVGKLVLYAVLAVYCGLTAAGYCSYGITEQLPILAVLVSALTGFMFTLLKTNGYLFAFREYDLIMSMPVSVKEIIASKFLYMYLTNLPLYLCVSLPMLVPYAIYSATGIISVLLWLIFSLLLPLIPMTLASLLGALITWLSSGFKHRNIIASILIIILTIFLVSFQFFTETGQEDDIEVLINGISGIFASVSQYYPPAQWFSRAITEASPLDAFLFPASSIVIFAIFVVITALFFKKVNSRLMTHSVKHNYKMKEQKTKSPEWTIAFKELKRLLNSTVYLTNIILGEIFTLILGIAAIFVDGDTITGTLLKGAPISKEALLPAIPMMVYLLVGMVPSTVCSPSLEGKNAWILKSMPISQKIINRGKILFNLCLTIPFALFATVTLCISFNAGLTYALLSCLCITVLCFFSTVFGMRCGIRYLRLDWENEVEVIKQGKAVVAYLFPNMFGTLILMTAMVFLNTIVDGRLIIILMTTIAFLLTLVLNSGLKNKGS